MVRRFQFQTGSIRNSPDFIFDTGFIIEFQFQTGSIRSLSLHRYLSLNKKGFNSKLVRLKVETDKGYQLSLKWFQFQTGSIKRPYMAIYRSRVPRFQFQTGSIKSWTNAAGNPIWTFQFQTGSIKRLSEYCINIITDPYSSCQVNFYFYQIREQFAVDL